MRRLKYGNWADALEVLRGVAKAPDDVLTSEYRKRVIAMLVEQKLVAAFEDLAYKASAESLENLLNSLANPLVSGDAIRKFADRLEGRMVDELHRTIVYALTPAEEARHEDKTPFGQEVVDKFPSSLADIDEANRCLVFSRYTACVFHLMRVVEIGVKALGARLAIDTTHKPGWETILKKAHGQMSLPNDKKDPDWIKDEDFLSDAITMLTAVKTAWRNPTMHIEKTYTPEHAERIYDAVKGFMQQLATKLHE
ncbi:MAG: hypothetical protein ACYDA0_13740 [Candidatus Dormibacteraceae bacterium]